MYHVVSRADAGAIWNEFVENHEDGYWWHRGEWIDYCLAKNGGLDLSIMVVHVQTRRVVAIVPVIAEGDRLGMGGDDLPWPLIELEQMVPEAVAEIVTKVGQYLKQHSQRLCQREVTVRKAGVLDYREAILRLAEMNFKEEGRLQVDNVSWQTRIIDLSKFDKTNMQEVRKSYKQLIRRGAERTTVTVGGHEAFAAYRRLHQTIYDSPRPEATYECMSRWIEPGHAVAAVIEEDAVPRGAMLWIVYKQKAYYASGAFADQDVAHPLMWRSLAHLQSLAVTRAELGFQNHAQSDKESQIEFFKRGFGGEDWPVPAVRMTFCDVAMASA